MALLMAVGIGLPVIVSADTKSDYRQAQDKLNQINKELESIKNEKKKQTIITRKLTKTSNCNHQPKII